MERLFVNANQICKDNPKFKDSLIVSLLHAAVAKHMYGSNAVSEEKVINFYRYIHTYNPKVAQVISANLHGPSDRWIRRLNSLDKSECIVDSGDNGERL